MQEHTSKLRHPSLALALLFSLLVVLVVECRFVVPNLAGWMMVDVLHVIPIGLIVLITALAAFLTFLSLTQPVITIDREVNRRHS